VILHTDVEPGVVEARAWRVWGVVVKDGRPARLLNMITDACRATRSAR
jgi:hypothetical protein